MQAGEPVVIPSAEGGNLTPSYVAISKTGERLVGQVARRQAIVNPENTVYLIKRFMGRKWDEPAGRELPVDDDAKRMPYKVVRGANNEVKVVMGGKEYSPPEISAMILQKLKADAEAYLQNVTEASSVRPTLNEPAPGHQGRRQDSRTGGPAYH
jgi:molecular chaperone DnaK